MTSAPDAARSRYAAKAAYPSASSKPIPLESAFSCSWPDAQTSIEASTATPESLPAKKPPMSLVVTALAAATRSAKVCGGATPAFSSTDLR